MDCKITSTKSVRRRRQAGTTVVEVLIAMGIGLLVTTVVMGLSLYSGRAFAGLTNYVEMECDSRNALDTMTRDIRQAVYLTAFATNQLTFEDYDGQPLIYTYSEASKTLTKAKGAYSKVLLTGCDSLTFSMFQRTPIGGSDGAYPATSTAMAKLIQVQWLCSRQICGVTANTESVQTAKIVIRKRKSTT